MTSGMYRSVGLRTWGLEAWIRSDRIGEDSATNTLGYGPVDSLVAVDELCRDFFEDGSFICPSCDEASEWNIHLELSTDFTSNFVGRQIRNLWRPCKSHREGSDNPLLRGIQDSDWVWQSGEWIELVV